MADNNGPITVCVGNYGYYNEGELHDAWITLPKTDEEIQQFLKENELQDPMHEEIYISDYDGIPFGLNHGGVFSEYTSLDDLNLLAKQMELRPDEAERVEEALETGCDAPSNIIELMNLIEQADDIPFFSYDYSGISNKDQWGETCLERCSAEENYGYTLLEGTELMEMLEQNSEAMSAFDVGEYGRQCAENSYVSLAENGYLVNTMDMPDLDYYSRDELKEMIEDEWPPTGGGGGDFREAVKEIPKEYANKRNEAWKTDEQPLPPESGFEHKSAIEVETDKGYSLSSEKNDAHAASKALGSDHIPDAQRSMER